MSKVPRLRADTDSESDAESGEERDVDVDVPAVEQPSAATPKNPFNQTALEKRRRGNVWTNVVLEDDLSSSLSKTRVEEDGRNVRQFVDLDNPSTSADAFPAPRTPAADASLRGRGGNRGRGGARGRGTGRGGAAVGNATSDPVVDAASAPDAAVVDGTAEPGSAPPRTGEKRKNVVRPRPKRSQLVKHGQGLATKTSFFSVYPNLQEEVLDSDRLDTAARKAVAQLSEKWNTWTITQIVSHLGNAETRKLLQLTKTIEQNGGMLTKGSPGGAGQIRRTPGGVFITLFKADATTKIGVEAVKKILAPAANPTSLQRRLVHKKRAVEKRAQRRGVAGGADDAPTAVASMETDVPAEDRSAVSSAVDPPATAHSMDVDAGTTCQI